MDSMKLSLQLARFLAVGVTGLGVLLASTYVLTEYLHVWYFWGYVVATLLSWSCIFFLNSIFTFAGHNKSGYGKKYLTFLAMYLGTFAVNAGIVYSLTSLMGLQYLLSIIVATAITTSITFTLSKTFIFTYGNKD